MSVSELVLEELLLLQKEIEKVNQRDERDQNEKRIKITQEKGSKALSQMMMSLVCFKYNDGDGEAK